MSLIDTNLKTGLDGLDNLLTGLIPGDNIVWQVKSVEDYSQFVKPFYESVLASGRKIVYFRFASHPRLVPDHPNVELFILRPNEGFEHLISDIHTTIDNNRDAYYVFDLLSDLAECWHSDEMLGNFFLLICPYILHVGGAIAYFALLRQCHATSVTTTILETAQVVINVFDRDGTIMIHPLKVEHRYSSKMYMLHKWTEDGFRPVTQSATVSDIMTSMPWSAFESEGQMGLWSRTFSEANEMLQDFGQDEAQDEELMVRKEKLFTKLLYMAITRDERVFRLAKKYLDVIDVTTIEKRMIGTGLIGGKSLGMLLARAIMKKENPEVARSLEPHDSFFVGSDVFYSFVVRNGLWWTRERQKDQTTLLDGAEEARQRILSGDFPEAILQKFSAMLDYFGQSPIIVRSSSLLEDNFGNSFAGKYDSYFCANQGPRQQRFEDFLSAVRTIFASTMSEEALTYRSNRGLLEGDEQMALLIQRVSGGMFGDLFYPKVAGVGLSYNPYVWSREIDPEAGVLRLVFGLGTRAVDRSDDDYTRVIALNAPERRVESKFDSERRYNQRRVDTIDLRANKFASHSFAEVVSMAKEHSMEMFATRDAELERHAAETGKSCAPSWILTFDRLIQETGFIEMMNTILATLQGAYEYPVETEFTANFNDEGEYQVNIVQCRPFQVKGGGQISQPPSVPEENLVLVAHGAVIGQSRLDTIDTIITVIPSLYSELGQRDRHAVGRFIGKINEHEEVKARKAVMLLGPGRWGTSTPSLGVPVSFSEIRSISVLCEIVDMGEGIVPDVSLGTHFFHELVEQEILYLALFPNREENRVNDELLESAPSRTADLFPGESLADVVRIIYVEDLPGKPELVINANAPEQRVVCYLDRG
jgi:pyruvate,water dikinase